jgi:hypothetical protein
MGFGWAGAKTEKCAGTNGIFSLAIATAAEATVAAPPNPVWTITWGEREGIRTHITTHQFHILASQSAQPLTIVEQINKTNSQHQASSWYLQSRRWYPCQRRRAEGRTYWQHPCSGYIIINLLIEVDEKVEPSHFENLCGLRGSMGNGKEGVLESKGH